MADKWADYCISQVQYNEKHTHIVKVMVHKDQGETIGGAEEWLREQVIKALNDNKTFVTIVKSDGKWSKGQEVRRVTINRTDYIRTDKNQTEADNLENLPEF